MSINTDYGTMDDDNPADKKSDYGTMDDDNPAVIEPRDKSLSCIPISPYPIYIIFTLYFFILVLNALAAADLIYDKVCFKHYADLTLCSNATFTRAHPELQDEATTWSTYCNLIQLLPSIISNLLLSNYCDKVGHKVPILFAAFGSLLASVWLAILCTPEFLGWPMEWLLIYYFLNSSFGYFSMVLMSGYSYVVLAVNTESRDFHMAIAEGAIVVGMILSTLASGPAIDSFGLNYSIYVNAGFNVTLLPVIMFGLREIPKEGAETFKWRDIFSASNITAAVKCAFKSRPNHSRLLIHLNIAAYYFAFCAATGTGAVTFLFFVKEVGLTITQFSYFNCISLVLRAFGAPLLLKLTKYFKLDSTTVAVFTTGLVAIGYIIQSLSIQLVYIFSGTFLLSFQAVLYAVIRSNLASIVTKDELGKIFAYDAIIQVALSSLCALCFNYLYQWSLSFWPSMYLAAAALLYIAALIVFIIVAIVKVYQDSLGDFNMYEPIE